MDVNPLNAQSNAAAQFTAATQERLRNTSPSAALDGGDVDLTITFWAYFDTTGANRPIVSRGQSDTVAADFGYKVRRDPTDFQFSVSNGTSITTITHSETPVSSAAWYFVRAWHNASTDQLHLAVNGVETTPVAHTGGINNPGGDFRIGTHSGTPTAFMNGRIQHVTIWRRLLTAGEATTLYASGAGMGIPAIQQHPTMYDAVAGWTLNEKDGQRNDSFGSNHLEDINTVTALTGKITDRCITTNSLVRSVREDRGLTANQSDVTKMGVFIPNALGAFPSIRFNGSQTFMTVAGVNLSTTDRFTVLVAMRGDPMGSGAGIFVELSPNASTNLGFWMAAGFGSSGAGSRVNGTLGLSSIFTSGNNIWNNGNNTVAVLRVNGTRANSIRKNWTENNSTTADTGFGGNDTLYIGARDGGSSYDGHISRLLIYRGALPDDELHRAVRLLMRLYEVKNE